MGKIDTVTKEYLRNPIIFSDLFNKFLYHGKQVIKPEDLVERDTTEITIPYGGGSAGIPEQKYRDVLKLLMTDQQAAYCILGIESAANIHYATPVKNMVYDSLQLAHQVSEAARSHKKESSSDGSHSESPEYHPSDDEYLSGFYKTDKLLPVVTLIIFFGPETWDGPLTLKEMYSKANETILQYAPDYKVNLIAPGQMSDEEIGEFQSSLKEVMLYIKYSNDKKKLCEVTQQNKNFQNLERQAAEVLNVTTNSKLHLPEGKEINMCQALEELVLDGKIKVAVETYQEVNFSLQTTIERVAEKFNLPQQRSEEEVKKYWISN